MQAIPFLQELEKISNPVITLNEIIRITGKSREYARIYVHRLIKRNLIQEVEKGKYTKVNDTLAIATNLIFPSYLSFISAYSFYGFTTQIPIVVKVVCLTSKKTLRLDNMDITFIKFKKRHLFGYRREQQSNHYLFIAEPEKAIIDSLYLPRHCPISESFEALKNNELAIDKLIRYALLMDSKVTIKRLGYLLELQGIDVYDQLKGRLNSRYDLLNPFAPKTAKRSSKWRLLTNEVFANDTQR
ncbi:hypothetical protein HYW21_07125 [Candidatus Woesearchaeota archaeon]|nr:hypothetical protein [Candidatus Woesearchaeota archaeon]